MNKHRNGIINHMVHFAFIFYLFNAQSVVETNLRNQRCGTHGQCTLTVIFTQSE